MNIILERMMEDAKKKLEHIASYASCVPELSIDTNNALNAIATYDNRLTPDKECHNNGLSFVGGIYFDEGAKEFYDTQLFVYHKINTPVGLRDAIGAVATFIFVGLNEKTKKVYAETDETYQHVLVEFADDSIEIRELIRKFQISAEFEKVNLKPTGITDYNEFLLAYTKSR